MVVWLLSVGVTTLLLIIVAKTNRFLRLLSEAALGVAIAGLPFAWVAFGHIFLAILALILHIWLVILPARLLMGRLEHQFLLQSTWQNASIIAFLCAGLALAGQWQTLALVRYAIILGLIACIIVGVYFLGQLWWNTRRYKIPAPMGQQKLKDLPTVSVCIAARNEDHALADCLASVLASDYPKLEVLVLDDCSQDKTPGIIGTFAHDGVRFIQGDVPATGWLGKNQAQQTLAKQASGDYLLFMDVDTHLGVTSISQVIAYALAQRLQMVGVLPQNRLGVQPATLFGTLAYFWRLAMPISKTSVPVSTNCWLVRAVSLQQLGSFASVSRKIVPETSFAARLAVHNQYRFLVSDATLGITTAKRWSSQIETATRVLYPSQRRQPLRTLAVCCVEFGMCLAPPILIMVRLVQQTNDVILWLSLAASALFLFNYYLVLLRVQPNSWLLAGLCWPIVVLQEVTLHIGSMLQYEFSDVNWKGRNVCYPVLAPRPPQELPQPSFGRR